MHVEFAEFVNLAQLPCFNLIYCVNSRIRYRRTKFRKAKIVLDSIPGTHCGSNCQFRVGSKRPFVNIYMLRFLRVATRPKYNEKSTLIITMCDSRTPVSKFIVKNAVAELFLACMQVRIRRHVCE